MGQIVRRISIRPPDRFHPPMPVTEVWVRLRQSVVAGKEEISQHTEQIKVHEQWLLAEQKW
jgi:hypothetical protein